MTSLFHPAQWCSLCSWKSNNSHQTRALLNSSRMKLVIGEWGRRLQAWFTLRQHVMAKAALTFWKCYLLLWPVLNCLWWLCYRPSLPRTWRLGLEARCTRRCHGRRCTWTEAWCGTDSRSAPPAARGTRCSARSGFAAAARAPPSPSPGTNDQTHTHTQTTK